jgi:hypothetical protein
MDKIEKYQNILCDILKEYASIKKRLTPDVKFETLIDKEQHHYVLLSIGWHKQSFVYTTAFHFDIIEGKIWLQQNNTDVMIADELEERGVAKSDIVLGFQPAHVRSYSGYAVA